ncbi:MAG: FAD-dependent tricarballylate dehydrogenase TcuA [Deltaproteobacteria bacterium]|nr:FAD-dependent tricarballylate dehydrogenase TcuA [Deltaproteobacteria bacterium]
MAVVSINETDVLIVGAGNAGLVAALAAHEAGTKVAIIERAPVERRGGNSGFSGGIFRFAFRNFDEIRSLLAESPTLPFTKVEVEPYPAGTFHNDLMRVTEGLADQTLTKLLVEESLPTVSWMASRGLVWELHVTHASKRGEKFIWRSGVVPVMARGGGRGLVDMLFDIVERTGIPIYYGVRAGRLLTDSGGAVHGVSAQTHEGRTEFRAKALILACGGFEANPEMRARYLGPGWDLVKVRGTRYNTGDGLSMSLEIGAVPFGHWSGCHASVIDAEAADVEAESTDTTRYSYPFSVMVNREVQRFVDEGEDFQVYTYAKIGRRILEQPACIAYQIFDQKTLPLLRSPYQNSRPVVAQSVDELADELEMDGERLKRNIEGFNRAVQEGEFDSSRRDGKRTRGITPDKSNWAVALDSPPFCAYAVTCGITFTYGGVRVDPQCRVVSEDDRPIPGLWAIGEMVGGFFYHNYPSGSGLTRGSITGRRAGIAAARYVKGR